MQIAIFLYDHMTALDAVGPYEVLSRLPAADTVMVAEQRGPVRCDTRHLALVADATLADVPTPDVVVVPGWSGARQFELLNPGPVHDWLRHADQHSTWTTSACTGSLILAAAGLLHGRQATTHWLAVELPEAVKQELIRRAPSHPPATDPLERKQLVQLSHDQQTGYASSASPAWACATSATRCTPVTATAPLPRRCGACTCTCRNWP